MKTNLLLVLLLGLSVSAFAQSAKAIRSDGTACAALPCVVGTVSLTDQTLPIAQTALFTPTTDGLFRVTFYMESIPLTGTLWDLSFKYTDDLKARNTPVWQVHGGQIADFTYIFREVAGQPITYTVAGGNNPPGASYDLFITVEQLQ